MLPAPVFAPETQAVVDHLQSLIAGGDENERLIDNYKFDVQTGHDSLFCHQSPTDFCPALKTLIQLLLRVIPTAPAIYSDLLLAIARPLRFDELRVYVDEDTILQNFFNDAYIALIPPLIDDQCLRGDPNAIRFVLDHGLLQAAGRVLLETNESYVRMRLLPFFEHFIAANYEGLDSNTWHFLLEYVSRVFELPDVFDRYVWLLTLIIANDQRFVHAPPPFASGLMVPVLLQLFLFYRNNDRAVIEVLSTFYEDLMRTPLFSLAETSVFEFLHHYASSPTDNVFLDGKKCPWFLDLLYTLLRQTANTGDFFPKFLKSHPEIPLLDLNDRVSVNKFTGLNLEVLPAKQQFFQLHFGYLSGFAKATHPAFSAMVHLITSETFFDFLVQNGNVSSESLKELDTAHLFEVLQTMASFEYSRKYLVSLDDIIALHLATHDPALRNKEIFERKQAILHSLLETETDLGNWQRQLTACLYEMENGRRIRDIPPMVHVETMTS